MKDSKTTATQEGAEDLPIDPERRKLVARVAYVAPTLTLLGTLASNSHGAQSGELPDPPPPPM